MPDTAAVAIIIVGFRNPADIKNCLSALSKAEPEPSFDIFICENGGRSAFQRLTKELLSDGPCRELEDDSEICTTTFTSNRVTEIRTMRLRSRSSNVWIACADKNLGYAGGINVWLDQLRGSQGWQAVWILNPDTEPEPHALPALVERSKAGNKGMVGSTILANEAIDRVYCRGGLRWRKYLARPALIGFQEHLNSPVDTDAIESTMDCPSGASMYVTRACVQEIGPMDERFFLFCEDLDWGLRAKRCGLGYARSSLISHKKGTATGSTTSLRTMSSLTVYLQHRNAIHLVRKHFPWILPLSITLLIFYTLEYLAALSPKNFVSALRGTLAGVRGETGIPAHYSQLLLKIGSDG
jgi:N-acetylglucosaminyl-diphospho-decaprenol L-rhamnosyltransferase